MRAATWRWWVEDVRTTLIPLKVSRRDHGIAFGVWGHGQREERFKPKEKPYDENKGCLGEETRKIREHQGDRQRLLLAS